MNPDYTGTAQAGLEMLKGVTISAVDIQTMQAAAAVTSMLNKIATGEMVLTPPEEEGEIPDAA